MKIYIIAFLFLLGKVCGAQDEKLFWSDEFNGTGAPDSKYWSYDLGATGYGNNEVQNYTSNVENSRQENGLLVIEARKNKEEWTSARLLSKDKFDFTYGKIVFRAKLPSGSGTWPALWMLAANIDTLGWPDGGEIDVMEHVGRRPAIVQCALHTRSSFGNTENLGYIPVEDYDKEFHTYEANWTPEKIEFSVDGNIYYTYNPGIKDKESWPFDKPFFIIMNIAMGGNLGSDPQYETNGLRNGIDPKLTSVRMEVDYVRVYKMPEHTGVRK